MGVEGLLLGLFNEGSKNFTSDLSQEVGNERLVDIV